MTREEKIEWLLFHDYIQDEQDVENLTPYQLDKKYTDCREAEAEYQYDLWVTAHMCE